MNRRTLALIAIVVVAAILRSWKLGSIPNGLYRDETAIGYNAYSILRTGRDEHGVRYPLYFKSFGDWKLPVYIYATVPAVAALGMTPVAVRLPSALFGILAIPMLYVFLKELLETDGDTTGMLPLLSAALLALSPWHIHYSRATFEVSIGLTLTLLGGWAFIRAVNRNSPWLLPLSAVCFGLTMWSYNLTRLLTPVMVAVLIYVFRRRLSAAGRNAVIAAAAVCIVFLLPFITTLLGGGGASSAAGTLIFSSNAVKAPILEFKTMAAGFPPVVGRILFSVPVLILWQYLKNVASYLSVPFFFISGSAHGNHGIGVMGLMYLVELPLVIAGIAHMLKTKTNASRILGLWAVCVICVAALTRDVPHATRSFFLLPTLVAATGYGLMRLTGRLRRLPAPAGRIIAGTGAALALFNVMYFLAAYFVRFPVAYAAAWSSQDAQTVGYIAGAHDRYDRIIIDEKSGLSYSSILFYGRIRPEDFHGATWSPDDSEGFSFPTRFGKYEFRQVDWTRDLTIPNSLVITSPTGRPDSVPVAALFKYPPRPVVLSVREHIVSYPVEDTAYVAVETGK